MAEPFAVTPRTGLGIATVMARKGIAIEAIGAALDATPPRLPQAVRAGDDGLLVGTGPGSWLLLREAARPDFAETLEEALRGLASVSDQSSAYLIQRFAGAGARTLLQRGPSIDLHAENFSPGSAATSMIAHIGVILWQVDDRPSYDVAVFRSYATSFAHWVDVTAAGL